MNPHLVCIGGEDHAFRIPFLREVCNRGFRVSAVSSGDASKFKLAGIEHRSFGFNRFATGSGRAGAVANLRDVISDLRPDVVQSFDTKPNLLTPLAVRGLAPVVRTINGLGWTFSSREPRALALRPVFCATQWLGSFWTSMTVFQNRDDLNFFRRLRLAGSKRVRLISSSGVDIGAFRQAQARGQSSEDLRRELGLEGAEIVMFVGRLTRQKGIATLINAIPKVLAQRPKARFVLVGPWQSEGSFAIDARELERFAAHVVVLGNRSDVPSLLATADVFAFPTEYREGVPRVLLEAGLAGVPIVASNMPGCSDVVRDGWNGYLVPPRNADALAARIVDLLEDRNQADAMGARSAALVPEQFALSSIVDQYCDAYRRALAERPLARPATRALAAVDRRLDEAR